MDIQQISSLAGLLSLGITLLVGVVGGIYMVRSGVGKQTNEAQESALNAMQAELTVLRTRVDDAKRDNDRLRKTIDTITTALKIKGIIITIYGEMVNIEIDELKDSKKSTVIRISDEEEAD
jgi:hypothetical protein